MYGSIQSKEKQIKKLINKGFAALDIANKLEVTDNGIRMFVNRKLGVRYANRLKKNGQEKLHRPQTEEANRKRTKTFERMYGRPVTETRGYLYRIPANKCEKCGITKDKAQLIRHHIKKAVYTKTWRKITGDNRESNIMILCNSCHQKLHYRKYGRKVGPKRDARTGRFLKGKKIPNK